MIKVHVPATSANCSVGFDCLGMALDWMSTFTFEQSEQLIITGCPKEFQNSENLVIKAFQHTCDYLKKPMPVFSLHIDSTIPFERGLGSSATCIVAGILACDAWFEAGLNKMQMLELATELEGHPDNVAPAIFGQACVSFMDEGKARMMMIPCANFIALAMIPDYPIKTSDARKVLPNSIDYKDACRQVAHAISFVQSLQSGNELVLTRSCKDYLHEPYRSKLIPEYSDIHDYCFKHEFPVWISGSGSTMLAMSLDIKKIMELENYIRSTFSNITCQCMSVSKKGAYISNE